MALLRPRTDFYTRSLPEAPDVYLVIEVADTSVEVDRTVKLPIYARAGVYEAWLLDVATECLEVHLLEFDQLRTQDMRLLHRGESVAPQAFPALVLTVEALLG